MLFLTLVQIIITHSFFTQPCSMARSFIEVHLLVVPDQRWTRFGNITLQSDKIVHFFPRSRKVSICLTRGLGYMPMHPALLPVSADDARHSTSHSLETAVRTDEFGRPGYMASIAFFHQLHCLVMYLLLMLVDLLLMSSLLEPYSKIHRS